MTIHYRPGQLNQSADGLFRCPGEVECLQIKEGALQSNLVSIKSKDKSQEPMAEIQLVSAKDRKEMPLSARQARDPGLAVVSIGGFKGGQRGGTPPNVTFAHPSVS